MYKTQNNCIFVVSHTARYDYTYSKVRGELVCRGAQTTDQDCKVRQYAGENHPASQHPSCSRPEWETASDCARDCHCLQHVRHYSPERQDLLCREGYAFTFPHAIQIPLISSSFQFYKILTFLIFSSGWHKARQAIGHIIAVFRDLQPFKQTFQIILD